MRIQLPLWLKGYGGVTLSLVLLLVGGKALLRGDLLVALGCLLLVGPVVAYIVALARRERDALRERIPAERPPLSLRLFSASVGLGSLLIGAAGVFTGLDAGGPLLVVAFALGPISLFIGVLFLTAFVVAIQALHGAAEASG